MTADILTVLWKERKGLFRVQGGRSRALLTMLLPVIMIAIILPVQMGRDYLTGAWPLVASLVIPVLLVGMTIPESFAGERERNTLPTLLASRLPDRAILFGKWALGVGYGFAMTLLVLLVSLITVNILHWEGQIMFYRANMAWAHVCVGLLMSGLIASLGVLVSLRSATVQGAQQALMSIILVPLMLLQVVPMLLLSVISNGRDLLRQLISINFTHFALITVGILAALNVGFLVAAMARFKRARLILD
jgi:ABC-2 type transport system permease protein